MWSKTKQRLESFLCPALKGRVEYFCTMYRSAHDHLGRACIIVDNTEVIKCSAIEFDRKVYDPNSGYVRGEGGHYTVYKKREFKYWTAEHKKTGTLIYSIEAFFEAVGFLFDNPISDCLNHFNEIVVSLALIDRRTGKRTLKKIQEGIKNRSELIRFFYNLRCESEKLAP